MALKNSKKHVELGLKGLGGQILTEGWINRSPETKKLQSVSCGQAAQEREGSSVRMSRATPTPSHGLQGRFLQLSNGLPMV